MGMFSCARHAARSGAAHAALLLVFAGQAQAAMILVSQSRTVEALVGGSSQAQSASGFGLFSASVLASQGGATAAAFQDSLAEAGLLRVVQAAAIDAGPESSLAFAAAVYSVTFRLEQAVTVRVRTGVPDSGAFSGYGAAGVWLQGAGAAVFGQPGGSAAVDWTGRLLPGTYTFVSRVDSAGGVGRAASSEIAVVPTIPLPGPGLLAAGGLAALAVLRRRR